MTASGTCLVIGGGIAGLIAATELKRNGFLPVVIDKGYGIGGRLASRPVNFQLENGGLFDYGAQHFTVGTDSFKSWVDDWIKQGIVREWCHGFYDDNEKFVENDRTFYRGVVSNRNIAESLATQLDIYNREKVVALSWRHSKWIANTEKGAEFEGDAIVLAMPVPQALELLEKSKVTVPEVLRKKLEAITYHRCISVLALLERESRIPSPGGMYLDNESLAWIASNYKKGISPEGYAVTLHASHQFSVQHWDSDKPLIADLLFKASQQWLGASVIAYHVHRWKYSQPATIYGAPFASVERQGPLVLAGDAFSPVEASSSVEGAVLSGLAAAKFIVEGR